MTMKKTFIYWMILSLFVTVDCFAKTANVTDEQVLTIQDAVQSYGQGVKATKNNMSVVNLNGTWFEMGQQYGMLMKKELEHVHQFITNLYKSGVVDTEKAAAVVEKQVRQTTFRISEFMRGASETSGLTVAQLQEVNAVERIHGISQCSAAFCWGSYADGPLVIGRNYDYNKNFSDLKEDVAVTVYHPSDGSLAVATIGYVGEIYAVNALNEKGIFLELNNGSPSVKKSSPNARVTGTTMLFSALFETDELADWDLFFNTTACSSSYIINMADSQKAVSYEWCPFDVKHGEAALPEGLMVSSNFFVNPDWTYEQPSDAACWNGITRRNNLINLCEASKGAVDAQKMKQIIETSLENGGAMNDMTVYQMVVVPEKKALWLRVIGGEGWIKVDLTGFLQLTTGIAQIRNIEPEKLDIRPGKDNVLFLHFNQAPKKRIKVTIYNLSGNIISQQSISPTGSTTYTVKVPQAQSGMHIVRVDSQEKGLTGSEIINWQ